jgi:TPP-dependent pyruvate/acetoin dehydrogenase alpha subunit
LPEIEDSGFESYDPSTAVRAELERGQREEELRALMEELGRLNDEAVERARRDPPPATVAAYRDVYGELPEGWPPE